MKVLSLKAYPWPPFGDLVRGHWYKATMNNGAVFEFWVPRKLKRKQARRLALEFADPHKQGVYESEDIESVRKLRGPHA